MTDQTADRDAFAAAHSDTAVKQPVTPPPGPGPAESHDADVAGVPADQLDEEIRKTQDRLAALTNRHRTTVIQEYPKVLYHTDHAHKDSPVLPVTVASQADEDEARTHGWVHANPGEADRARSGETPNATQHTREDENARRDLPAQMALDQDARTGKPPIDLVVDSDAPDPGAPNPYQGQPSVATGSTPPSASKFAAEANTGSEAAGRVGKQGK